MFSASTCASCVLFASLASSCSLFEDYRPSGYACIYGVSRYNPSYGEGVSPNLSYADDDAYAMELALRDQGYNTLCSTDTQATKERIIADLAEVGAKIGQDDTFILYFSGHGGTIAALDAANPDEEGASTEGDEWIFPYGSLPLEPDPAAAAELAISDDELAELLDTYIPLSRRIVIIDACTSGGFAESAEGGTSIATAISSFWRVAAKASSEDLPPPFYLCSATEAGASAEYGGNYQHSVFTFFLLRSRYYGDLDSDGYITLSEIRRYAAERIEEDWNANVGTDYRFSPDPTVYRVSPVVLRRESSPAD